MAEDIKPNPDPSVLTTEQLIRELASLKNEVIALMNGIAQRCEDRDQFLRRELEVVDRLRNERFSSISTQISERDTQTEKAARDVKAAVDAAFAAQKEAVTEQNRSNALAISKSEAGFTKQLDSIGTIISTMGKGLDDKIDDLKTRVIAGEANKRGGNDVWGYLVVILGLVVSVLSFVLRK